MTETATTLPDDVSQLKGIITEQILSLQKKDAQIERLAEMVRLLRHQHFGRKSEKVEGSEQLGMALHYAHAEWVYLIRYLDDGRLSIDNNMVENAIRPFAVGRKNWLFSDSVAGAKSSAAIYSVLVSAKLNGHNEHAYLRHLLVRSFRWQRRSRRSRPSCPTFSSRLKSTPRPTMEVHQKPRPLLPSPCGSAISYKETLKETGGGIGKLTHVTGACLIGW